MKLSTFNGKFYSKLKMIVNLVGECKVKGCIVQIDFV